MSLIVTVLAVVGDRFVRRLMRPATALRETGDRG